MGKTSFEKASSFNKHSYLTLVLRRLVPLINSYLPCSLTVCVGFVFMQGLHVQGLRVYTGFVKWTKTGVPFTHEVFHMDTWDCTYW